MKIYYKSDDCTLYQGKMQDVLDTLPENSIDSIITDPPYCLADLKKRWGKAKTLGACEGTQWGRLDRGFMGKEWDDDVAMQPETWAKAYRVLKRGGYLLAFGGTRTFHRIACAIEDAGFEIRDCIMWLYGSGFPKSMNIGKAIEAKEKLGNSGTRAKKEIELSCEGEEYIITQPNNGVMGKRKEFTRKDYIAGTENAKKWSGWGTSLKPAYEPIIVARKPVEESVVNNVLKYGVGGINIDECRIYGDEKISCHDTEKGTFAGKTQTMPKIKGKLSFGQYEEKAERIEYHQHEGRFPSNVILDGSEEVCAGMPYTKSEGGCSMKNSMFGLEQTINDYNFHDSGSASRYFYSPKASKKDRDNGLDMLEDGLLRRMRPDKDDDNPTGLNKEGRFAPVIRKNTHPTVKPVELMQYLVRLVSPKGATILDCFMGSGSTGKAVMFENRERNANYKFIGIEMTEEYLPIAKARIEYARDTFKYDIEKIKKETGQLNIFNFMED